ncbi:MAG: glycosyltransferase family 2 protein [Flavobacteriales bacterium]|nr:glycosyltransferase family 2 protein [Flavobacteriales bacterium]
MEEPLVSIITPAYNDAPYIAEAISSVLNQTWKNWELLIVNDGSTDDTARVIAGFDDPRIRVFHKPNGGIGSARNLALDHARGAYICGLDSDDVLPPRSIASRMEVFLHHPDTDIVDGRVLFMNADLTSTIRVYEPDFEGEPFNELIHLSDKCFMGFSWLIRWEPGLPLRFTEDTSHGEDLLFYFGYAPGKYYRHTNETVLLYRRTGSSVMSDLDGLDHAYRYMTAWLAEQGAATKAQVKAFHRITRSIMSRSYLKGKRPLKALLACMALQPEKLPAPVVRVRRS